MPESRPSAMSYQDFASLRYSAGGLPLTRLLSQRGGALLAWLAGRLRLAPVTVTLLGLACFLATASLYALAPVGWLWTLSILVLLQLGYALDCADGQLARATAATSVFGAWIDLAADYTRNIVLSAAAVVWLVEQHAMPVSLAVLAATTYAVGAAVSLHTLTFLRAEPRPPRDSTSVLRWLAEVGFDTVTILAVLAVLRDYPLLLAAYLALMGMAFLGLSVRQALQRLVRGPQST